MKRICLLFLVGLPLAAQTRKSPPADYSLFTLRTLVGFGKDANRNPAATAACAAYYRRFLESWEATMVGRIAESVLDGIETGPCGCNN